MPGDPAPWFHQRSTNNPNYAFDMAAGHYIVLGFYATTADEPGRASIEAVLANRHYFDDDRFSFFGVSLDPTDETEGRVGESLAKAIAAHGIGLIKSIAVRVLMATVVARELAIDVVDDSSLRSAGKIVGGNDLIAE